MLTLSSRKQAFASFDCGQQTTINFHAPRVLKLKLKPNKALDKNLFLSYGASPAIWDHTVLPASRHKRTCPTLIPASKLVLDLPTPDGWKAELTRPRLPSNAPAGSWTRDLSITMQTPWPLHCLSTQITLTTSLEIWLTQKSERNTPTNQIMELLILIHKQRENRIERYLFIKPRNVAQGHVNLLSTFEQCCLKALPFNLTKIRIS